MTNDTTAGQHLSVKLFIRAMLRLAALAGVLAAAGGITFGYLGWLHPAFDSFSHFRIHLAVGLLVLVIPLLVLRFLPEAGFAALLGATAIFQTTGAPFAAGPGSAQAIGVETPAVYTLLQLNLRFDNPEPARALSLIGELRPDVVTLNEVSDMWIAKLDPLKSAYPYRLICPPPAHVGGSAILSRRPFAQDFEPTCADRGSFARAKLDFGGSGVEIAALHLGWPWPFEQPWQLPQLEPVLAEIADTAILAGDFNAAPWSQTTRRVAEASGTRILRGIGPTWLSYRLPESARGWIGLPIDQVLVKGGVVPASLKALDNAGSDHLPVLLEFTVLPQEQPAPVRHAALGE
jgi:endonuclease/exonuclease/phosphatase (EEP) superfamily protein YafD